MSEFEFEVNIYDNSGTPLGSGPLTSVTRWEYTARFDRAGSIAFAFDAADHNAQYATNTRIVRAMALLDGVWTEVGAGRIDQLGLTPMSHGVATYGASGLDLIGELGWRSVGQLEIGKPNGTAHANALDALAAFAPSGWTFLPAGNPGNDYIYARYDGESVLGALVYLAEKTGTHFYRSADRTLTFTGDFLDSGKRAVGGWGDRGPNECTITSLTETIDTHGLLTRVYPYGSGTGRSRLTLAASNRTAPPGYVFNRAENYIENLSATAQYGLRDFPALEFKEITPISNTAANMRAAANMLFDSALAELRRRSTLASQRTYDVELSGCQWLLRPMQTIRIINEEPEIGVMIDEELKILEATWAMDSSGIQTTRLVVSTDDRWPESDASAAAERAVQGRVFQAHPQLGPNSYWENATLYVGSDLANHVAEFPFVLGPEVSTIDRVRFRYKVTEALSMVSIVAGKANVDFDVDVNSISVSVSVSGNINISHTHSIPDHQHTITVAGGSAGDDLLINAAGGTGFLTKATPGDLSLNTNVDSGATTSSSGGSTNLALSGSGTGSGSGSGSGAVDLSDAIGVSYGVNRAGASRTYDMDELEYSVNGGAWADLTDGVGAGDGYYEIDITNEVMNADDFTPLHENNVIEIRRKSGAGELPIDSSQGQTSPYVRVGFDTQPEEHGLAVGEEVIVTGTTAGVHDGVWKVVEIQSPTVFFTNQTTGGLGTQNAGTVTVNKSAMILAKLGVVDHIQSVAIT